MKPTEHREAGLTIIELLCVSVILLGLVAGIASTMNASFSLWRSTSSSLEAEKLANRTLHTLTDVFISADSQTVLENLDAPTGGSRITFQSQDAGGLGPVTVVEWLSEPGDPQDGIDNDSDGLIDEGMVARTQDLGGTGERVDILVRGVPPLLAGEQDNDADDNGNGLVDEQGFCLVLNNRVLTIRITVLRKTSGGAVVARTSETSVALRD